jgi:hypothetical protein
MQSIALFLYKKLRQTMTATSSSVTNTCLKNKRKSLTQFLVEPSEKNFLRENIALFKFYNIIPSIARFQPFIAKVNPTIHGHQSQFVELDITYL